MDSRGKEPTRDKDRSRAAIISAAGRLFAQLGFDAVRVEMVAKAAALNKRLVFYYFGSKRELYVEVLESAFREFEATVLVDSSFTSLKASIIRALSVLNKNSRIERLLNQDFRVRGVCAHVREGALYKQISRLAEREDRAGSGSVDVDILLKGIAHLSAMDALFPEGAHHEERVIRLSFAADFLIATSAIMDAACIA